MLRRFLCHIILLWSPMGNCTMWGADKSQNRFTVYRTATTLRVAASMLLRLYLRMLVSYSEVEARFRLAFLLTSSESSDLDLIPSPCITVQSLCNLCRLDSLHVHSADPERFLLSLLCTDTLFHDLSPPIPSDFLLFTPYKAPFLHTN
ncbi:hypothetical protein BJV78DRAFT_1229153 [Lactifluus subvellereus]|nr:hypothetical protein BJV78DRAFT_1229153 [Lactifluus subvellereus]